MPSNHLVLCRPLILMPSIFPSIRVFSFKLVSWPPCYHQIELAKMQIHSYLVVWGKGLRKTSYRSGSHPGVQIGSEEECGKGISEKVSLSKIMELGQSVVWAWKISSSSIYIRIKSDLNDFKPMEEIFLVNWILWEHLVSLPKEATSFFENETSPNFRISFPLSKTPPKYVLHLLYNPTYLEAFSHLCIRFFSFIEFFMAILIFFSIITSSPPLHSGGRRFEWCFFLFSLSEHFWAL